MTINDIAKLAKVSKSTVSRVLNNASNVDEKTRQLVLKVMEENHYVPSVMAQSLVKKESCVIGLIVPDVDNAFFGAIIQGINDVLKDTHYTLLLCCTNNVPQEELRALHGLHQQRVSGLFLTTSANYASKDETKKLILALNDINAPIVLIDRVFRNTDWDGVYSDNIGGAYAATRSLIDHGFTKIGAYITDMKLPIGQERYLGFRQAMEEANLPIDNRYLTLNDYSASLESVYLNTCHQIKENRLPDAIFLSNRIITNGFFKAILEHGIIPGTDIHCMGFDYSEILNVLNIPYSYLERNLKLFGQTAANLLLSKITSATELSPIRKSLTVSATLHLDKTLSNH